MPGTVPLLEALTELFSALIDDGTFSEVPGLEPELGSTLDSLSGLTEALGDDSFPVAVCLHSSLHSTVDSTV